MILMKDSSLLGIDTELLTGYIISYVQFVSPGGGL